MGIIHEVSLEHDIQAVNVHGGNRMVLRRFTQETRTFCRFHSTWKETHHVPYPLINSHSFGKSPFFMGKSTINGCFQ